MFCKSTTVTTFTAPKQKGHLQLGLHPSARILAGVRSLPSFFSSPFFEACALNSTRDAFAKRKATFGVQTSSPLLVLGLGASSWAQSMATSGAFGGKSFLASARPSSNVEQVLKNVEWPEQFPFKEEDFQRDDISPDSLFYKAPRFVTHVDDPAIAALTKFYSSVLAPSNSPGISILDICSSWISHYPEGYKQERIVGMGMNEQELKRNSVLTEYIVQDLNVNPTLPFEDDSFDVITNVVSVDYLTKPLDVFKEMSRILKPGGQAMMSFSDRCFWTKAISIWTSTGCGYFFKPWAIRSNVYRALEKGLDSLRYESVEASPFASRERRWMVFN